jgi:hypothetical protein
MMRYPQKNQSEQNHHCWFPRHILGRNLNLINISIILPRALYILSVFNSSRHCEHSGQNRENEGKIKRNKVRKR